MSRLFAYGTACSQIFWWLFGRLLVCKCASKQAWRGVAWQLCGRKSTAEVYTCLKAVQDVDHLPKPAIIALVELKAYAR